MRRVARVRAFKSDRSDGLFKKNTRLLPSRFHGNRKPASSNDYARRGNPRSVQRFMARVQRTIVKFGN